MVTDDPEHKKNLKTALAGAFDDDKISKFIVCCLSTNVKSRWFKLKLFCGITASILLQGKEMLCLSMAPPSMVLLI